MANKKYPLKATPVYNRKIIRNGLKSISGSNRIKSLWARYQFEKMQNVLKAAKKLFKTKPSKILKFKIKKLKSYLIWRVKYS